MTTTETTIPDQLREWARGSLPCMAAVDFLIDTGTRLYVGHPMIATEREGDRAWLDVFGFNDPEREELDMIWTERVGGMSSGERATWELVRSICDGELNEWWWRLDGTRKAAFLRGLANHAV